MSKISRNIIDRFARFAIGADESILSLCPPHEQRKILNKAALVIIPALLALVSGRFAAEVFTQSPWVINGVALVWALLIFMLDRAIVIQTRDGQWSLSMLLRMGMAVVLSLLVTEPIVQRIFQDPIVQRENMKVNQIENNAALEIEEKTNELNMEYAPHAAEETRLRKSVEIESDGTGGTQKIGTGPIYWEKRRLFDEKKASNVILRQQLNDELVRFSRAKEQQQAQQTNSLATGLSGRLATLHEIMDENWIINWAVWLMRILFFLIEIMPLTLKMGGNREEDDPDIYTEMSLIRIREFFGSNKRLTEQRQQIDYKRSQVVLLDQKQRLENKLLQALADNRRIQIAMILERQRSMEHLSEEAQIKYDLIQDDPVKQKAHEQYIERMRENYQRSLFNQYIRFASEGISE